MLIELAEVLANYLSSLFQLSLDIASVPSNWKTARVSPIYKKGDKSDPANYRPISLTSLVRKLLEHIVTSQLMRHSESGQILYQH